MTAKGSYKHDFTGKRVGNLTVVCRQDDPRQGTWWLCECDCGEQRIVRSDKLLHRKVTTCKKCTPRFKDMTGKRFGRLTVLRYAGPNHRKDATWLCRCDCGNEKVVQGQALRSGATVSCGCYQNETSATHHGCNERLYRVWSGMRRRCNNEDNKDYPNYGAKGVRVCDEWNDYGKFRDWALANGYDESAPKGQCTIDRINPFGDYEPSNCRWADMATQARNRRNSRVWRNNDAGNVLAAHASASQNG